MTSGEHMQRAVNDATSQLDRQLSGVEPELGAVDSRSFAQLLSFAADYGELLRFYNLEDRIDGDWRLFFTADPTQINAGIVAVDLDALARRFGNAFARASAPGSVSERVEALTELVEIGLALARRIDGWQLGAAESEHAELLDASLQGLIDGELGISVRKLYGLVLAARNAGLSWPRPLPFEQLSGRWRMTQAPVDEAALPGRNWAERIEQGLVVTQAVFETLSEALALLQGEATAELERDLIGGRRRPQLAMWISFVDLFRRAQRAANSIADRYVDFYYRDVLRMEEAEAQPDSAYLLLALAESELPEQSWVAAGTEFTAEAEDGGSLIYAAVEGLAVSSAALSSVRTLRVERTSLGAASADACAPGLWVPTTVSESIIDLEVLAEAPNDSGSTQGFSTFGRALVGPSENAQTDGVELTKLAQLGLLIASSELALAGGRRLVTLTVGFGSFAALLRERIAAIRTTPDADADDDAILATMLGAGFQLRVSTADGWVAVPRYSVIESSLEAAMFALQFELVPSFPAVAPISEEVETPADVPETRSPCLVLDLRQELIADPQSPPRFEPSYLLSLLAGMPISTIELGVEVRAMTPAVIENSDGQVDPSSPFLVFGAAPVVGSYLRLACPELFAKQISQLQLTLDWYDLPSGPEGFYGYYSGYKTCPCEPGQTTCFDNCVFEVDIGLGERALWQLQKSAGAGVELFRGKASAGECGEDSPDPRGPLCEHSVFGLAVQPSEDPPDYYLPADNYLEVRLASPSYAFGDSIYAENVLAAVVDYLPDCIDCTSKCEARYLALRDAAAMATRCLSEPSDEECSCFTTIRALLDQALTNCEASGCEHCGSCRYFSDALTAVDACIDGGCSGPACSELPSVLYGLYQQAVTECIAACSSPPKQLDYPNTPWQPQATAVKLRYASGGPLVGELQHLLPFGGRETLALPNADREPSLLPEFEFAGALHLGFAALVANSPLTLLFRMAAAIGLEPRPKIRWSSLGAGANERAGWNPLELRADGTGGLCNTGILALRSVGSSLVEGLGFADGLHWLRATVEAEPEWFPNTLAIDPHALVVRDQGRTDDPADRYHRLAAHSITASVAELGLVATIDQPLPSFGGHPAEDRQALWLRASERLRHKSRAIQTWDQERLVLERHPWVWKVRVLSAHDLARGRMPGAVLVLVIPKLEEAVGDDPRTPRASPEQLRSVRETLTRRASVFAQIEVVNPNYRELKVITKLAFVAGENPVALRERLDAELVAFLSPGFFDLQREALGGDYVAVDEIEAFVQSRPYVRYVESLTTERASTGFDATLDWCFLTSAPSHTIVEVDGPRCEEDAWSKR